jgi:F0F1-type ATP synthase membrane subunit c/vacuolar-type H+-ATPase subunit K
MLNYALLLHFLSIAVLIALTILGVALGQSFISQAATEALNQQPKAALHLQRTLFIALTINEMAALLSVIMIILLITTFPSSVFHALAQWAIVSAVGIPSCLIGLMSVHPIKQALFSVSRQPFFSQKIINIMMFSQTIMQTPLLLGFIIAGWLIRTQLPEVITLVQSLKLLASGFTFGLATIGPTVGLSTFFARALYAVGINRSSYQPIFTFIFMSQAFIETPLLFAIFIAGFISFIPLAATTSLTSGIVLLAAGIIMALCAIYTSINSARSATSAITIVAKDPSLYPSISRVSLFSQALIDTIALYGLIIATLMIYLR